MQTYRWSWGRVVRGYLVARWAGAGERNWMADFLRLQKVVPAQCLSVPHALA